jgi:hypothetical protein
MEFVRIYAYHESECCLEICQWCGKSSLQALKFYYMCICANSQAGQVQVIMGLIRALRE